MAQKFQLLFALWLVAACLVSGGAAQTTDSIDSSTDSPFEPTANSTINSSTPPSASTPPEDPCVVNPCPYGSTCEKLGNEDRVCLCIAGEFYSSEVNSCIIAKIFSGQLTLATIVYEALMQDKASDVFEETARSIIEALSQIFKDKDGYLTSTVLELRPIERSKFWSRLGTKTIATVDIVFSTNSGIKTSNVTDIIDEAGGSILSGASFNVTGLCEKNPCDELSTTCESEDGLFNCLCKENYIKTPFSSRACSVCPSGYKSVDFTSCTPCPFGYTGFACSESWQLILVIVGSVLGGLLLITLIVLFVSVSKSSKKSSKQNEKIDNRHPLVSPSSTKAPLVNSSFANSHTANGSANSFASSGMPKIPRATATNGWDSRSDLEMGPSNSRPNPVPVGRNSRFYQDHDNMNPYAQARPLNPYDQRRPQINPYASSQGHSNPSYIHDNGRRFN